MCLAKPENESTFIPQYTPIQTNCRQGSTTSQRTKLWELEGKLHCPVIGTCLTNIEIRNLVKRIDKQFLGRSDYWLHTYFVTNTQQKNALSLAVHKFLERKYSAAVKRFAKAKDRQALYQLWQDSLARGATAEGLWATLSHGQCDVKLKEEAFETIHMLSHQIGAGQQADLKRLTQAEAQINELKQASQRQQKKHLQQITQRDQQIQEQQQRIEQLQLFLSQLQNHHKQHHIEEADVELVKQQNQQLQQRFSDSQSALQRATEQRDHWQLVAHTHQRKLDKIEARHQQDMRTLEAAFGPAASATGCGDCNSESCNSCPDLAGKSVLCVGGLHRLTDQYRAIIERSNGQFVHHDGGKEDSRKRLESMLAAADVVICAVDCVSHDAYYKLKRFCKQQGKRHVFMESSSLSSFASTVNRLGDEAAA